MTLTAPGCGMGPFIVDEVQTKISALSDVDSVSVDLVFDPPWSQEMMSDEAKITSRIILNLFLKNAIFSLHIIIESKRK